MGGALDAVAPSELLAKLGWMSGSWRSEDESTEEMWTEARGGTLIGVSRVVHDDRTVHYEYLRIEQRRGGVVLVVSPVGQASATFELTSSNGQSATFEDRGRGDFPERIVYVREGDALQVRAEGPSDEAISLRLRRR